MQKALPQHHLIYFLAILRTLYFQLCEAACLLPGRVPGYSRSDIQLLPSSDTKRAIWRSYITVAEADATIRPVAYGKS